MSTKGAVYPQFFNPERLGESLKEVSSDVMRVESREVIGRWFHGPDDTDLFIWIDEAKQIVKQQLSFYGQVVEWNAIEGTKTGVVIEEEMPDRESPGSIKASEIIRFDERAQTQPLGLAMDLIKHVQALNAQEKQQIITNFFRGQKRAGVEADLLKSFAHWKVEPQSGVRRRWGRVGAWLKKKWFGR